MGPIRNLSTVSAAAGVVGGALAWGAASSYFGANPEILTPEFQTMAIRAAGIGFFGNMGLQVASLVSRSKLQSYIDKVPPSKVAPWKQHFQLSTLILPTFATYMLPVIGLGLYTATGHSDFESVPFLAGLAMTGLICNALILTDSISGNLTLSRAS
jgi:hypothetical protein